MHRNFRIEVVHHRHIEGLGHTGDLHPAGDAAGTQHIDHDDIHRACFEHVTERRQPVNVFAAGNRRRQRVSDARKPRIIVMRSHVFEPEQIEFLDAATD